SRRGAFYLARSKCRGINHASTVFSLENTDGRCPVPQLCRFCISRAWSSFSSWLSAILFGHIQLSLLPPYFIPPLQFLGTILLHHVRLPNPRLSFITVPLLRNQPIFFYRQYFLRPSFLISHFTDQPIRPCADIFAIP